MRPEADEGPGLLRDDDEVVEFGGGRRHKGGPWLARLLLACLVLAAAGVVAYQSGNRKPPAPPPPPSPPTPPANPLTVINVGHRLLGVTAGWELFASGRTVLVRIQLARGRITETTVPALQTGLPEVSFIIGPHQVIVSSPDLVPGYVIKDGAPARLLTGPFTNGGPVIPGPTADQVWVMTGTNQPSATLVNLNGHSAGSQIQFQRDQKLSATSVSDGRGNLLVLSSNGSIYDVGPTWSRRIPGQIIAIGPTAWLALACRAQRQCSNEVIDPANGARRLLPGPAADVAPWTWPPLGVISPDGSTAAVLATDGPVKVQLINLRSGASTTLGIAVDSSAANDCLVWSPDGKWLFVADARGQLLAVNASTRRVQSLGVQLPNVEQVAIRRAAG